MHGVKDIIRDAESLPAEERIAVIDSLLRTLNRPSPEIDKAWIKVAKAIPGDQIFAKIKERFDQ